MMLPSVDIVWNQLHRADASALHMLKCSAGGDSLDQRQHVKQCNLGIGAAHVHLVSIKTLDLLLRLHPCPNLLGVEFGAV